MNPQKRKGDKAEREAAELLTEVTGFECQRNLSAGIPGDVGDIHGVPNCVIQVADWKDKSQACLVKPREVEVQRKMQEWTLLQVWSGLEEDNGEWC